MNMYKTTHRGTGEGKGGGASGAYKQGDRKFMYNITYRLVQGGKGSQGRILQISGIKKKIHLASASKNF